MYCSHSRSTKTFRVLIPAGVLLAFGLSLGRAAAAGAAEPISDRAWQQIVALQQEKLARSPIHRKLDSQFVFQLKLNRGQVIAPGVTQLQPGLKFEGDGRVLVDIDANVTAAVLAQIKQGGGTVLNSFPQFHTLRALVTLDQLENLAGSADVQFIRRAREAHTNTGSVTSEGDVTHRANLARSAFGADGRGVKVGVLSDSVDSLASSQASGDLGEVTVLPGQGGGGSGEGTAMLEIVHDLAPGAQLYFATAFNGEASFAQNILDLRSHGCDIIVDDVSYRDESPFQDGVIAQAVNAVTASGALYFSSAANDGNLKNNSSGTWEGDFVDGGPAAPPVNNGGGALHSFGPATFNTVMDAGYGVDLFWADPLGAATNDYDLFVLDATGTSVVASSLNLQDGTQDPYENVYFVSPGNRLVIVKTSGDARFLHLVTSRGRLKISTTGATKGHNAAAAAFGVAAVDAATSYPDPFSGGSQNPVEWFSSDGPRRVFFNADGTPVTPGDYSSTGGVLLQKPDLAAADDVMTSLSGFQPFRGTSAAAPHAAAIAALLWSYNHGLGPDQIRTALTSTALDIEAPGSDANSGAGLVMAYEALRALPPHPFILADGWTLVNENCPDGAIDPGETVTLALALTNSGAAGTSNLVATLLSSGGVTYPSGPQNYGGLVPGAGSSDRLFTFIATGNCGGTNVATLQLKEGTNELGTVSFALPLGRPRVVLSQNLDAVTPPALPPGWTTSASGAGAPWRTTNSLSDTPPIAAYVSDPGAVSDQSLVSPSLFINTASARLTFRHRYDTEFPYDGGVLEISTSGGAFTDILAAGGSFVSNGYAAALATGSGNPLQGRLAWTGYSGGFITTMVALPAAAAGKNIRLRWRLGSDSSVGYDGWYVDTISLSDGFTCCGTATNDLVVSIAGAPDPVVVGGHLTYTININNTGPAPALGVSLTDVLPDRFSLQSITFSEGVYPGPQANGGGTLTFNLGTLPGGGNATIVLGGTADSLGLITNRVSVSRTDADANAANNLATAVTAVVLPSLSINDVSLLEGNSGTTNAVFTVTVWPPPGQTATVNFATTNGSAVAGSDYVPTAGTLVFAPGVTNQTIAVPVIGDPLNEANESFTVNLSAPTNALLAGNQGRGTILNDDPLPNLSVGDVTVVENSSGTTNAVFTVSLNVPSGQPVTVNYFTADGTAFGGSDYVSLNSALSFDPGQTSKTITVVVNNHATAKPGQTFYLNLDKYTVMNAKIARDQALGTIVTALPGQLDRFVWSAISSPQSNGTPFAVTLIAQDYWNSAVSNFNDPVTLSASALAGQTTNDILGSAIPSNSYLGGNWTDGYAFTPNTNLTVTHVRHYFGSKVSIWTDAGVLLASQNVTSVPGTWVETPLPTPIQLVAGTRYRVAVFSANVDYFWRSDLADVFPYGTIDQSYEMSGDAFPANPDGARWWFVDLRYTVGLVVPVPVTPTNSGNFTNGIWSGSVTVQQPATNVTLRADDGLGHFGLSQPIDVAPQRGPVTHFVWSPIASPQSNGAPFAVSVTAQDYFNDPATNFTGPVALRASGIVASRTNHLLGDPAYTDNGAGAFTFGYSFTPRTNLTVTHVRHFFGNRVTLWTDAGVQLAVRAVTSLPGTWKETALTTPIQLLAGQRYRIGVYTGSATGSYYWRSDLPGTFPDGTIDQGYEGSGLVFPTTGDSARWWFVDLRYTVGIPGPVPAGPTSAADFVAGIWSGNLAVFQAATNVTLRADDGRGHVGQSLPFNVAPAPGQVTHFVWSPISSPQLVGEPFAVSITAQDYLNVTATNFTGPVALSGLKDSLVQTNTLFGNLADTGFGSGDFTVGYAFTPNTNLLVTHVRHYAGTKVSLWTDGGVLLARQNVTSLPGTWVETPLPAPVPLQAGQRYRIAFYSGGGTFYGRTDQAATFADATIDQAYYANGDAFPNYFDGWQWIFVDIRYTIGTAFPVALSLTQSDNFTDGVWSGNVAVLQSGNNVTLLADDDLGHLGRSFPFSVAGTPKLAIARAGDAVVLSWPVAATGFTLESAALLPSPTNWLPVPNAPAVVGDRNTVTNLLTAPGVFYRLRGQ